MRELKIPTRISFVYRKIYRPQKIPAVTFNPSDVRDPISTIIADQLLYDVIEKFGMKII